MSTVNILVNVLAVGLIFLSVLLYYLNTLVVKKNKELSNELTHTKALLKDAYTSHQQNIRNMAYSHKHDKELLSIKAEVEIYKLLLDNLQTLNKESKDRIPNIIFTIHNRYWRAVNELERKYKTNANPYENCT